MSEPQKPNEKRYIMNPRLGTVQAIVEETAGDLMPKHRVRFASSASTGFSEPMTVEEVATLRQLCEYVLRDIYAMQMRVFANPEEAPEKEGDSDE